MNIDSSVPKHILMGWTEYSPTCKGTACKDIASRIGIAHHEVSENGQQGRVS